MSTSRTSNQTNFPPAARQHPPHPPLALAERHAVQVRREPQPLPPNPPNPGPPIPRPPTLSSPSSIDPYASPAPAAAAAAVLGADVCVVVWCLASVVEACEACGCWIGCDRRRAGSLSWCVGVGLDGAFQGFS